MNTNIIYNNDCLMGLRSLPDNSIVRIAEERLKKAIGLCE